MSASRLIPPAFLAGALAALAPTLPARADVGATALLLPLPELRVRPVAGAITSRFGRRNDPIRPSRRKHHSGIDFEGRRGTPVRAAGEGLVVTAGRFGGYGRVVFVDHGLGVETRYAHLDAIRVREGEMIPAGAILGTLGSSGRSTGPHLHFEVRLHGRALDPLLVMGAALRGERDRTDPPSRRRQPSG